MFSSRSMLQETKRFHYRAKFFGKILRSSQRKYAIGWLESLQQDYLLHKPLPWICFEAIKFINSRLSSGMQVFEYGSGGSTLFWLSHGMHVTSVEHDPAWFYKLQDSYLSTSAVDYRLILPERTERDNFDSVNPDAYYSGHQEYSGYNFRSYCNQIDDFPNEFFDLVLVDGRARPSSIKHSCRKVKVGGILILDNSDKKYYLQETSDYLSCYERNTFFGVTPSAFQFTEASVFIRKI